MKVDAKTSLFLMLGRAAQKTITEIDELVPKESLLLSPEYDLAAIVPDKVRQATDAAEAYKLFFVIENYLREFIVEVKDGAESWYEKVPTDAGRGGKARAN